MMSAARAASPAADRKPAARRPAQARYDIEQLALAVALDAGNGQDFPAADL